MRCAGHFAQGAAHGGNNRLQKPVVDLATDRLRGRVFEPILMKPPSHQDRVVRKVLIPSPHH